MMNEKMKMELELIRYVRKSILKLVDNLSAEQFNHVPANMKNNVIWNIGHMVFTQQILCYQLGGLQPTIDVAYFAQFAPDTLPGEPISEEEIAHIKLTFIDAFEQLAEDALSDKLQNYQPWTLPSGIAIENFESAMLTNLVHEGRHFGVVISLVKLLGEN